jgi:hypothetical protein
MYKGALSKAAQDPRVFPAEPMKSLKPSRKKIDFSKNPLSTTFKSGRKLSVTPRFGPPGLNVKLTF